MRDLSGVRPLGEEDKDLSVHMHLMYEEVGIWLLNQIGSVWKGKVYMSLIKDNDSANDMLMKESQDLFSSIEVTLVENKGTDQWGFYNTHARNKDDTKYVLYAHDKKTNDPCGGWLKELIDPFITQGGLKESLNYIREKDAGIVSAEKHKQKILQIHDIIDTHQGVPLERRHQVVGACHTTMWLKELQWVLALHEGLVGNKYPDFCAGNVFLAKRDIVSMAHACAHPNFFTPHYAADGNVEHGLERFYFYVSECLGYSNKYV